MKNASRDRERIIKQLFGLQKVLDDVRQLVGDSENDDEENDGGENRPSSRFPAITDLIPRCRGELESLKGILEENLRRKGRMQALIWPLKEADVNKTVDNLGKFQHLLMSALSVDQTYVTIVTFDTILIFLADAWPWRYTPMLKPCRNRVLRSVSQLSRRDHVSEL